MTSEFLKIKRTSPLYISVIMAGVVPLVFLLNLYCGRNLLGEIRGTIFLQKHMAVFCM